MEFAKFGLGWRGVKCPYFVLRIAPSLPKSAVMSSLSALPQRCGMNLYMEGPPEQIALVADPVPCFFASDETWWLDLDRAATLLTALVDLALRQGDWNGTVTVGLAMESGMVFKDRSGHWASMPEPLVFNGATLRAAKQTFQSTTEWHEHLVALLASSNNLLYPVVHENANSYGRSEGVDKAQCFLDLIEP